MLWNIVLSSGAPGSGSEVGCSAGGNNHFGYGKRWEFLTSWNSITSSIINYAITFVAALSLSSLKINIQINQQMRNFLFSIHRPWKVARKAEVVFTLRMQGRRWLWQRFPGILLVRVISEYRERGRERWENNCSKCINMASVWPKREEILCILLWAAEAMLEGNSFEHNSKVRTGLLLVAESPRTWEFFRSMKVPF